MQARVPTAELSICQCCMLLHANGECCAEECHAQKHSKVPDGQHVTLGALTGECGHSWPEDAEAHTEGCEDLGFRTSACDLCGDPLHGDRYAAALWPIE